MFATRKRHQAFPPVRSRRCRRKGAILVFAAFMLIVMLAMLAFAVDLGYVMNVQTELKRATDAAALAGAGSLVDGPDVARLQALDFMLRNPVAGQVVVEEESREALLAAWLAEHPDEFQVELGDWDPETKTFTQGDVLPSTIRVVASRNNASLFFGKTLGQGTFSVTAESIARYMPRDIVLVLDFSASMNDDSELRRIQEYGEDVRGTIEAGLLQVYQDLGSPTYGTMQFEPDYMTLIGRPPSTGCEPQLTVKFLEGTKQVYVTSTKDLSNVVLQFSDGSTQKIEPLSGLTGTFGDGSRNITKIWVKSGCNESGEGPGYGERFERAWTSDNQRIQACFALDAVPYPYPSGSWDTYINYVKSSSYISAAGYRKKYGYLTLVNYWLEQKPTSSQTPDLWKASAQPVTAVKNAVAVFMDYIQEVDCEDRVGLVVYNSPSQTALLEYPLTDDFAQIENTAQHRQAGHYDRFTNIGAGIYQARLELASHARPGAFKMIVLMTDGRANRPPNETYANSYVLQQAQAVAGEKYPIVTVSLGNAADTDLMQQVADITKGIHFNVPGGGSVVDYREDLLAVFRKIANDRPLALVK